MRACLAERQTLILAFLFSQICVSQAHVVFHQIKYAVVCNLARQAMLQIAPCM